jgi:hypothetical protein
MSGQDWSIQIVPAETGGDAAFVPDIAGAKPGDPLLAGSSDLISWNNRTADEHQPWPADHTYAPLSDGLVKAQPQNLLSNAIPAWTPSTPAFTTPIQASTLTINYICKIHPQERGQIIVNIDPQ